MSMLRVSSCFDWASIPSSKEKMLGCLKTRQGKFAWLFPHPSSQALILCLPVGSVLDLFYQFFIHCYELVFQFIKLGVEFFECVFVDLFGCREGVELGVAFGRGTQGYFVKTQGFFDRAPGIAFGDVAGYGQCGILNLSANFEWDVTRVHHRVNGLIKFNSEFPYIQFPETAVDVAVAIKKTLVHQSPPEKKTKCL